MSGAAFSFCLRSSGRSGPPESNADLLRVRSKREPKWTPAVEAIERLFTRANPRGADDEIWRHSFGCRAWLVLTRHRSTHQITAIRAVGPEALA